MALVPADTTPVAVLESDSLGIARTPPLSPGAYSVRARALAFDDLVDTVTVRRGMRDTLEFQMRTQLGCTFG
jgi:hypothetical protein